MSTAAAHTDQTQPAKDEETQHVAVTITTLVLFAVAVYVAFSVLALPVVAALGFSVIVPSVIVSTLMAIMSAARNA